MKKINTFINLGFTLLILSILIAHTEDWRMLILMLLFSAWCLFLEFDTNVALKRKVMPWVKFCDTCGAIVWERKLTINDSDCCWRCQSKIKE
ncbi:MAG: hypothetical protein LLG02_13125 [Pelosinus sp.]|nr:hypothetical protein [Pelosinus sp.]